MLDALVRKFASREALKATAAQVAVTWGVNHLGTVVVDQAERIELLEAMSEAERLERVQLHAELDALRAGYAYLDLDPDEVMRNAEHAKTEAPPSFGVAAEHPDGGPSVFVDLEHAVNEG